MQFFAVLALLAAAAIASPVPDKTVTVSIPHITTATVTIPETTFTASRGSYVETFTVPTLPTDFPKPSFPAFSIPSALPSFPGVPSKPTASPSKHWRFAQNE